MAGHTMTVLRDEGLHRHVRFAGPDSLYRFEIVTRPGALALRGETVWGS
jgi:hypothetical protein